MEERRIRVLVCGERLRSDDAAALLAIEGLPEDARALADVREVGQLDVDSLLEIPDAAPCIVADAAVGIRAGEIVTIPLERVARSAGSGATPASSHALPPDQVLALAGELRGSPPRGDFVGIGGVEFGFGERLSPAVAATLPAFTDAIAAAIRRLAAS